jgi:CubicO group peptidase (beta-lactamase class C family)
MKNLIAACALACATAGAVHAQSPVGSRLLTDSQILQILVERIDTQRQSVGMVVGVVGPTGRQVVAHGHLASGDPRPLDGDTVFEIGSVTKVFTSLLLADMAKRGEVALTDPVAKFVPVTMPERDGQHITLQDLATHTSGLPRLPSNLVAASVANPFADYSIEQLYQFLSGFQLARGIGSQYEYSNLGGGLLGLALARRTGTDYETLIRSRICGPLGMESTRVTIPPDMKSRQAIGHDQNLGAVPNWEFTPATVGAAGLRSTANDLLTFLEAILGSRRSPLSSAMTAMLEVRRQALPNLVVALGWHVSTIGGHELVWHSGGTGGYTTFLGYDPRARRGVVVLSNAFATNGIDDIGRYLLDATLPLSQPASQRKETAVDPELFDLYVGRYQAAPNVVLHITREGSRLFAQATGQPRFELFPESDRVFFFKVMDAQVSFETDGRSRATRAIWHQAGLNTPAQRTEVDDPQQVDRPERRVVATAPTRLEGYVGRYQLAPNMILAITREGDRLLAQATGQGRFELFPDSESSFFAKVADIQIDFEPGEQGRPTALILRQSGANVRANRVE